MHYYRVKWEESNVRWLRILKELVLVYVKVFFRHSLGETENKPRFEPVTNQLHGAEPFLRSRQLLSHSRIPQHFMEPEASLPCSQEPSASPYPEPDQSSPYHPILSLWDTFYYYRPTYVLVFLMVPSGFPTKTLYAFFSPMLATCPAHLSGKVTIHTEVHKARSLSSSVCMINIEKDSLKGKPIA
jgi:hypothetical protein